jgi:ornithine cyclodeaminase
MPKIKILTETDLRAQIRLDLDAVACVETAFEALATKNVVMPPILSMNIAEKNGEVDVKTAYVPGLESFAIKISPGFFDNVKLGLPSLNGLMVLFSANTGFVEALLLDNGYLTVVRTAAAGAMAAKHLARADATTAAILGGGEQGRLQLEALTLVRPIERARIWARRPEQAAQSAAETSAKLGIDVTAAAAAREAVKGADIIVTTTPSTDPILMADWLEAGQHITAMGSDSDHKNELEPACLAKADLYVCDRQSQCLALGELRPAVAAGLVDANTVFPEIGQVIAGQVPGRTSADQITICDQTGTGIQDTAIATLARQRCEAAGTGAEFES